MKRPYRRGVLIVLTHEGRLLLTTRSTSKPIIWQLPSGGVEKGESTMRTFYRELYEELGLRKHDVKHVDVIGERHSYDVPKDVAKRWGYAGQHLEIVRAELKNPDAINLGITNELADYTFVPIEDAHERITFDDLAERIKQLFSD